VKCWGAGAEGQLGNGTRADTFTPAEIRSAGSNAVSVASAGNSTCAAFDSGQVRCWGENQLAQRGEEGDGFDVPILVRDVESQRVVSGPNANGYCARIGDGSWLCWGSNRYGLLGTVPSLIFEPTLVEPTEL
ncbi:MAG: RCC1 domain-containing protein, partial [Myxococcota bacterium]